MTAHGSASAKAPGESAKSTAEDAFAYRRSLEQAIDEGHDADIPSSIGYILDDEEEERRRDVIAGLRKARTPSRPRETDVEKEAEANKEDGHDRDEEASVSEDEANIVWWDGPNDPENPYNWPMWRKVINCGLVSAMTFVTPLASCKSSS